MFWCLAIVERYVICPGPGLSSLRASFIFLKYLDTKNWEFLLAVTLFYWRIFIMNEHNGRILCYLVESAYIAFYS